MINVGQQTDIQRKLESEFKRLEGERERERERERSFQTAIFQMLR